MGISYHAWRVYIDFFMLKETNNAMFLLKPKMIRNRQYGVL